MIDHTPDEFFDMNSQQQKYSELKQAFYKKIREPAPKKKPKKQKKYDPTFYFKKKKPGVLGELEEKTEVKEHNKKWNSKKKPKVKGYQKITYEDGTEEWFAVKE